MIGLIKGLPHKVNMAGSPQPIVTFTSNVKGLDIPEIIAYFSATQSGTGDPSPSNIRAISGFSSATLTRTGANIFGGETFADIIVNKVPNATKDTTNKIISYSASNVSNVVLFDKFNANTQYTFYLSATSTATNLVIEYTDGTTTPKTGSVAPNTFVTSTVGKSIKKLRGIYHTGTSTLKYDECGIFLGAVNSFAPYSGTSVVIPFGDTYYGGYLNVTTGLLTVTHSEILIKNASWSKATSSNKRFYTLSVASTIKRPPAQNVVGECLCEIGSAISANYLYANHDGIAINTNGEIWLFFTDYVDKTKEEMITDLGDYKIVYELATPQTYQLTPAQIEQLLGQNNVFCSSGDVEVTQIWARRDRSIISRG